MISQSRIFVVLKAGLVLRMEARCDSGGGGDELQVIACNLMQSKLRWRRCGMLKNTWIYSIQGPRKLYVCILIIFFEFVYLCSLVYSLLWFVALFALYWVSRVFRIIDEFLFGPVPRARPGPEGQEGLTRPYRVPGHGWPSPPGPLGEHKKIPSQK